MRFGSLEHEHCKQAFRKAHPDLFRVLDAIAPYARRSIAVGEGAADFYDARKTAAEKGANRC